MTRAERLRPNGRRRLGIALVGALVGAMAWPQPGRAAEDPRIEFLEAVKHDDAGTVGRLLAAGVSPNLREKTAGPAIVMAAKEKSYAALSVLAGARGLEIDATDDHDQTALMIAAIQGNFAAVERLILQGASVNRRGWTPLHYAAVGGNLDVIRILLRHGARVDAPSPNRTTPVMMAARHKNYTAMELLADAGADLTARNDAGFGVLDYLERYQEAGQIAAIKARIARRGH